MGFDVQKYVGAIVIAVYIDLEQLEKGRVLLNELFCEPCRLRLWVRRVATSKQLNCRSGDSAVIRKLETNLPNRSERGERWVRTRPVTSCPCAARRRYKLSSHCM